MKVHWKLHGNRLNIYSKNVSLLEFIATAGFCLPFIYFQSWLLFPNKEEKTRQCSHKLTREAEHSHHELTQAPRAEPQHPRCCMVQQEGRWCQCLASQALHQLQNEWLWTAVTAPTAQGCDPAAQQSDAHCMTLLVRGEKQANNLPYVCRGETLIKCVTTNVSDYLRFP